MMSRYKAPRRHRRRTVKRRLKIGPTIGKVMAFLAVAVLGIVSLTQAINREAAVYESTEIRSEKGSLEQEINELKLLEARAKTLERIAQSEVKDEMVPIGDDVEYIEDEMSGDEEVAGVSTNR